MQKWRKSRKQKKELSKNRRDAANRRWARYHANQPERQPDKWEDWKDKPLRRIVVDDYFMERTRTVELFKYPKHRNRFQVKVNGKSKGVYGWSEALAEFIRKACPRIGDVKC